VAVVSRYRIRQITSTIEHGVVWMEPASAGSNDDDGRNSNAIWLVADTSVPEQGPRL